MLANNNLSGQIPEALNDLTLNRLWLKGNDFIGCIPANLLEVPDGDAASLNLPVCDDEGPTPPPGVTPTPATPQPSDARLTAIEDRLTTIEGKVDSLAKSLCRSK